MISRADLDDRVREWQLRDDVVEKDYVLGWILWGIGSDAQLQRHWVFKGGTCLKKCYIETYRFSEDLDFTVLPGGPVGPEDVERSMAGDLESVRATTRPFKPVHAVEFTPTGRLHIPPQRQPRKR